MLQLIQPVLSTLIGLAVAVFAGLYGLALTPGVNVWHAVAAASPHLLAVLAFIACVALAVAGLVLLVSGLRATRRRIDQVQRVPWNRMPETHPGSPASPYRSGGYDEDDWR